MAQEQFSWAQETVVTEKPGSWFGVFSGKHVIAQTKPEVNRDVTAECVLDLAYEIEHPLTLTRVFESKNHISYEQDILLGGVWERALFLPEDKTYLSFNKGNGPLSINYLNNME